MSSTFNVDAEGRNRVLVAEDDPLFRTLLQRRLERWGYTVLIAEDGAAAWRELQSERAPRLLLLDWMMPAIDGVEICRRIRALQQDSYSYILVVTARQDKEDVVTALNAGADDFISKPIEENELRARIQVGRRILDLHDELLRSREQLRVLATIDPLTGLANRRAILALLSDELSRAAREQKPTGVLMLDIDRFKLINDRFGHQAGDSVLAEVAGRIAAAVRSYDRIGRYGGEEFLAVLPNCSAPLLESVAERIRFRIAGKPISVSSSGCARRQPKVETETDGAAAAAEINVSVSIGGSVCEATMHLPPDEAIAAADRALYSAKNSGRNRCVIGTGAAAPHAA